MEEGSLMELVKLFNWKFTGYMELPRLRGEVWQGTTVKNLSYQVGNTGLEKSEVIGPSLDYRSSFFFSISSQRFNVPDIERCYICRLSNEGQKESSI